MADQSPGPPTFGPYRLDELVGRGGMGEVWRAYDTRRRRSVALKRLGAGLSDRADLRARFRRESELAARLAAPNVIPIHDYGEIDGQLYLDMRLVTGRHLGAVLAADGPLSPSRTTAVLAQLGAALDAAHCAGLVHRDVKPSNVLLTPDDFVYLVDFGIAKPVDDATVVTTTGGVVGTLGYMAPERLRGNGDDARGDVYSLACLLYECLTGRAPYPRATSAAVAAAHLHDPVPLPSDADPHLAVVDAVVVRGMAKDPDRRFASAGELARAAATVLAHVPPPPRRHVTARWSPPGGAVPPGGGPPPTLVAPGGRPARRRRWWIAAGAVAAVVAAAVAVPLLGRGDTPPDPVGIPVVGGETGTPPVPAPVAEATVPGRPTAVALTGDGRAHVVTARLPGVDDLVTVDATGTRVGGPVDVTAAGGGLAASPDGRTLYVPRCRASLCALDVLDAGTGSGTAGVRVGEIPTTVVVSADGRRAYVLVWRRSAGVVESEVVVVDIATRSTVGNPIPVASSGIGGLALSGDGTRLVVADARAGSVQVVDTALRAPVGRPVPVGTGATDVAVDAGGTRAYVTDAAAGTLAVVDLAAGGLAGPPIRTGDGAGALALSPDGTRAYVANRFAGTLSVVDVGSGTLVGDPVAVGPEPVDVSAGGSRVAVLGATGTLTLLG